MRHELGFVLMGAAGVLLVGLFLLARRELRRVVRDACAELRHDGGIAPESSSSSLAATDIALQLLEQVRQ